MYKFSIIYGDNINSYNSFGEGLFVLSLANIYLFIYSYLPLLHIYFKASFFIFYDNFVKDHRF